MKIKPNRIGGLESPQVPGYDCSGRKQNSPAYSVHYAMNLIKGQQNSPKKKNLFLSFKNPSPLLITESYMPYLLKTKLWLLDPQ